MSLINTIKPIKNNIIEIGRNTFNGLNNIVVRIVSSINLKPSENGLILLLPTLSCVAMGTNFNVCPERIQAIVIVVVNEKPLGYK